MQAMSEDGSSGQTTTASLFTSPGIHPLRPRNSMHKARLAAFCGVIIMPDDPPVTKAYDDGRLLMVGDGYYSSLLIWHSVSVAGMKSCCII